MGRGITPRTGPPRGRETDFNPIRRRDSWRSAEGSLSGSELASRKLARICTLLCCLSGSEQRDVWIDFTVFLLNRQS